jgi:hypothetical protein
MLRKGVRKSKNCPDDVEEKLENWEIWGKSPEI